MRLKNKSDEYNCKMVEMNESYTSKTCGSCGKLNDIGGNKIYKCNNCDFTWDRNFNGARNIMIKHYEC